MYVPIAIFLIVWGWFCKFFSSFVFLEYISPFKICCKAGLVVLNSVNSCLSEKLLIFPSMLNEILAEYSNLGCRFFPLNMLNISCPSLLACRVSAERSPVKPMGFPLYITCCFSLWESNRQEDQESPNGGNRLQVSDIFKSLSLKQQEETNYMSDFFPFSIQFLKEVSFNILCCHNDTWFHLNLTFLKPWANQCMFLMEMFFLSYVNKLCIYPKLCLQVGLTKTQKQLDKPMFYLCKCSQAMLMRLCLCLETCLTSRFMSIILWSGTTHLVPMLSQNACCGWGAWCQSLSFETSPYSN